MLGCEEQGRAEKSFWLEIIRGIAERSSAIAVGTAIQLNNFEKSYESELSTAFENCLSVPLM